MASMHIKPENRGKFTRHAHAEGKSVQEAANSEAHKGGIIGKEANFARMSKRHWKPLGRKSSRHSSRS